MYKGIKSKYLYSGVNFMLKIAIYDREKFFQEKTKNILENYLNRINIIFKIDTFDSENDFNTIISDDFCYDVIYISSEYYDSNFIDIVNKLRNKECKTYIIFVTSCIDYLIEGYKLDVIRYIEKNDDNYNKSVCESIDAVINKIGINKQYFKFIEEKKYIPVEDILYVESKLHKLYFYVQEKEICVYTIYNKLDDVEKILINYNFLRIHQSYLVNVKYIKEIKNYMVILKNEIKLVIPKSKYKRVKNMYYQYKNKKE